MDIDLGCSAAVLRRRLKKPPLRRLQRPRAPQAANAASDLSSDGWKSETYDGGAAARRSDDTRSFTVSCSLTRVSTRSSSTSSGGDSSTSTSISTSTSSKDGRSRSTNNRSGGSSRWRSSRRSISDASSIVAENRHQLQVLQNPKLHQPQPLHQPPPSRPKKESRRDSPEDNRLAPEWTERLLLVLQPPPEEAGRQRSQLQPQFQVQRVRQIFCVLFRLDLLAKLLSNLPSLKAIVNKARCCVKLRDALLFRRLPRTGCMVKYMMFSFEGNAKCNVAACLRFLEAFDPAFALRRPWRSRDGGGCPALVLRWNRQVPENTLLSMFSQRLMTSSRFFCCSPVGPNTGWKRAEAYGTADEEGGAPEGLLG